MDISNWVAHRASWAPSRIAIRFAGTSWSNIEFEERVGRLAAALRREIKVSEGDRIAHLGLNSPDLLALLFASARIGAIMVPLNWRLTAAEHEFQLADAAPTAILVEAGYWSHIEQIRGRFKSMRCIAYASTKDPAGPGWIDYEEMLRVCPRLPPDPRRELTTPCEIQYTSGTSGKPKGSVRTQEGIFFNAINSGYVFALSQQDHVLTYTPMFHAGGMHMQTTPAVHWGATITIQRRFDAGAALTEIRNSRPTLLLAVPAISAVLTSHPDFLTTDVSCVKCVGLGSSMVPDAVIRPWLERGVPINQIYGLTEAGPNAIATSIEAGKFRCASAGKPVPYMEAKIVNAVGQVAAPGERGEIRLKGPALFKEYWRNSAATEEAFDSEGWFKTGDIAHIDDEGFYYIHDRIKDVIISGGENIYPAELENILTDCDKIVESTVIGRPHPKWVEVPVCIVVKKPGSALGADDVLALFHGKLAHYKHPREVMFVEGPLPRTSLGKVQKFKLREQLGLR